MNIELKTLPWPLQLYSFSMSRRSNFKSLFILPWFLSSEKLSKVLSIQHQRLSK